MERVCRRQREIDFERNRGIPLYHPGDPPLVIPPISILLKKWKNRMNDERLYYSKFRVEIKS